MPEPPPTSPRFAVVRAPSGLGLRAAGVEGLGDALLGRGLAEALAARTVTTVAPLPGSGVRDPASGVLNGPEVVAYAISLADAVGTVLDAGDVPLVLGGDCSVLLGGTLALRRRDRAGLLFLDGHADFHQPSAEPWGEAASMDLALVTGHKGHFLGDYLFGSTADRVAHHAHCPGHCRALMNTTRRAMGPALFDRAPPLMASAPSRTNVWSLMP